jgi:hypothetical protein
MDFAKALCQPHFRAFGGRIAFREKPVPTFSRDA